MDTIFLIIHLSQQLTKSLKQYCYGCSLSPTIIIASFVFIYRFMRMKYSFAICNYHKCMDSFASQAFYCQTSLAGIAHLHSFHSLVWQWWTQSNTFALGRQKLSSWRNKNNDFFEINLYIHVGHFSNDTCIRSCKNCGGFIYPAAFPTVAKRQNISIGR